MVRLHHITARHKITGKVVDMKFQSITKAKEANPDFDNFVYVKSALQELRRKQYEKRKQKMKFENALLELGRARVKKKFKGEKNE